MYDRKKKRRVGFARNRYGSKENVCAEGRNVCVTSVCGRERRERGRKRNL